MTSTGHCICCCSPPKWQTSRTTENKNSAAPWDWDLCHSQPPPNNDPAVVHFWSGNRLGAGLYVLCSYYHSKGVTTEGELYRVNPLSSTRTVPQPVPMKVQRAKTEHPLWHPTPSNVLRRRDMLSTTGPMMPTKLPGDDTTPTAAPALVKQQQGKAPLPNSANLIPQRWPEPLMPVSSMH